MLMESASKISFFGAEVYAWGLYVALGAALALIALSFLFRRARFPRGTAALCGVLMLPLGFVVSRLFYCLFDGSMRQVFSLRAVFYVTGGGYSMFGALAGACLGVGIAGRILKLRRANLLDAAACALLLFVACARLGEGYTELGVSRPLVENWGFFSFFVTVGEYDNYLSTYLVESLTALILFIVCARDLAKNHRAGDTALMAMLLFGAAQTVLESLRFDQHMRFSFVSVQQLFSCACVWAAVIVFAARRLRQRAGDGKAVLSLMYLPIMTGVVIWLEFLIDRSGLNRFGLYGVYILLMTVPCVCALKLRGAVERAEEKRQEVF